MNTPLRAAIVGPGRIASTYDDEVAHQRPRAFFQADRRHPGLYTIHPVNHAAAYRSTAGYELAAVVGRGSERIDAFRERWDVAAFTDLEAMLAETRPDVVSVCTQSNAKADITVRIARAGTGVRAIIVEKAMATSMAETDAMIAACEAAGIELIVNYPYRFSPMAREARSLITNDDIGALGTLSGWSGGGSIHGGTHTFDLLQFLGGPIAEVTALSDNSGGEWADRGVNVLVRFKSGATGFVSLEREAVPGFDIRGSSGAITFSSMVGDAWVLRSSPLDPDSRRVYPLVATHTPMGTAPHDLSTTQRLFVEVHEHLHSGTPVVSTGRDGAAALEAGIASLISAREQRAISLPLTGQQRDVAIPNR